MQPAAWKLASGMGVAAIEGKGRGLVALKRLERGTLIASEEPLGVAFKSSPEHCDVCGDVLPEDAAELACPSKGCEEKWCSKECRAEGSAWHWLECGETEALIGAPGDIFRLCIRIFFATPPRLRWNWAKSRRASVEGPLDAALASEDARVALAASLPNHKAETQGMREWGRLKSRVKILAKRIAAHLGTPKAEVKAQLIHIVYVAYTNTFNLYRDMETWEPGSTAAEVVGSGLYPSVSLLNHSCLPNTSRLFRGRRMEMRLIRDVEAGTEITTTYGTDVRSQPTRERRSYLTNWCFTCTCEDACGSDAWQKTEAEFRAIECRWCGGPTGPDPDEKPSWALETIYQRLPDDVTEASLPHLLKKALPLHCGECGNKDILTAKGLAEILTALLIIRQRLPFRPDLASLARHLHPGNQQRLIALWTVQLHRCLMTRGGSLDEPALAALAAVHANYTRLHNGAYDICVVDDAVEAMHLLSKRPLNAETLAAARGLFDEAYLGLATHYGTDSEEIQRLCDAFPDFVPA